MEYTAEWVNNVGLPQRAQSSCPLRSMETYQQRKVALSAPAMSVRSKTSKTARARSLIEMELKQMKERQKLDKESRELEQEMKREELERQRKWAELRERRQLQEMEARLAKARLEEDMGIDSDDSDLGFDQGEQVQEGLANDLSQPNVFQPGINNENVPNDPHLHPEGHPNPDLTSSQLDPLVAPRSQIQRAVLQNNVFQPRPVLGKRQVVPIYTCP